MVPLVSANRDGSRKPPYSNTGVRECQQTRKDAASTLISEVPPVSTTICIDWISITFKGDGQNVGKFLALYTPRSESHSATPRNGYTAATVSNSGVLCMWHDNYPEMGYHVIFDGTSLRYLFQHGGVHAEEILKASAHAGGSVTRLDLAEDAQNDGVNMQSIWDSCAKKQTAGTARKFARMNGLDGGDTIYIGSRQSERFVRLYDKAAEMNLPGQDWKRLELELKGMMARAAVDALVHGQSLWSVFDMFIKDAVDIPENRHWRKFFTGRTVDGEMTKIQRVSDRETWIDTQVIKAVMDHYIEHRDSEAVARLIQSLDFIKHLPS